MSSSRPALLLASAAVAGLLACGGASHLGTSSPGMAACPDSILSTVTAVRDTAVRDTMQRTPRLVQMGMVPLPVPSIQRGKTTTTWFYVDERGRLVPDSLMTSGFVDRDYERKFRQNALNFEFQPAVYRPMACAIRGWYWLKYRF